MATVKTAAKTPAERAAEVLAAARAASASKRYSVPAGARRGTCADLSTVVLGTLAQGKRAGEQYIVRENGDQQLGMPYHVFLTCISDGVIPADIIRALLPPEK